MADIQDVKSFWESSPLFTGEGSHAPKTKEFFEEHCEVLFNDCYVGVDFEHFIPDLDESAYILDLGCGIGFWTTEFLKRKKYVNFYSGDLTENALDFAGERLRIYGFESNLSIQNAEHMTYEDEMFDHVNCQGVIHHSPDTEQCVRDIARVTKKGGTVYLSVYYKNFFLRNWNKMNFIGKFLSKLKFGMKGRGREKIYSVTDVDELVRLYDGDKNPIGKAYSKKEFHEMVSPHFDIDDTLVFFFPSRSVPFRIPVFLHGILSRRLGFMLHLKLTKK